MAIEEVSGIGRVQTSKVSCVVCIKLRKVHIEQVQAGAGRHEMCILASSPLGAVLVINWNGGRRRAGWTITEADAEQVHYWLLIVESRGDKMKA